MKNDTRMTKNQ